MKKLITLVSFFLLTLQALASDFSLGVKFFKDGLYSLASKTFQENIKSLKGDSFKKYYRFAYLSFLKTGNFEGLAALVNYWKENLPDFHAGELLALEALIKVHGGENLKDALNKEKLLSLPIDEKISFFKVLSYYPLRREDLLYVLNVASRDIDLKGALKESGFLKKVLKRAVKEEDYQLMDQLFDAYGKWFSSKEETLEYVKYLERKKRFSDALVEAEKLYKKFPADDTRLELTRVLYLNKKYQRALELLDSPRSEEERYLKAWCLFKLGKFEKIPLTIGMDVSKPELPNKLKALLSFYEGEFNFELLKKYYPELYNKAVLFSFSDQLPEEGNPHDLGYLYYERGMYSKAFDFLEKAVQNSSNSYLLPRTLFLIGKLGSFNRDVANVVYTQLMTGFQNTPYYREAILPAAKSFLYIGNTVVALKLLSYAESQLGIKNEELYSLLGRAYITTGDYKSAVRSFLRIKNIRGEPVTFLAKALFKTSREKEAFKVLKKAIERKEVFPEVNGGRTVYLARLLGKESELKKLKFETEVVETMAWIVSGDFKQLEANLSELNGNNRVAASLYLAFYLEEKAPKRAAEFITYALSGAVDPEAERFFRRYLNYLTYIFGDFAPLFLNDPKFIAYNPENSIAGIDTLISKAQEYISSGELSKAYGLLKLALQRVSSNSVKRKIVSQLVSIDLKQRLFNRALADILLLPKDTQEDRDFVNYLRFKILLAEGKLVDAFDTAKKIKNLNNIPPNERPLLLAKLANYYKLTGNKNKAYELAKQLISSGKLKDVDYDDLIRLAIFLEKEGFLKEAGAFISEAMKKAEKKEQKVESLFWKAAIQAELGDVDGAILNYMKIAYEYPGIEPWSSTAIYRAARLFEKKGDLKQALKLYRKVVKLKAGTKEGEVAAERVKSLLQRLKKEE